MTKNDKILLICSFIIGCIVTFFVSGCSKPQQITYELTKVEEETTEEDLIEDKLMVYTALNENHEVVTVATCKGCHFVCHHCEPE